MIHSIKRITDSLVGKDHGGFREGKGWVDQIFALGQVMEKNLKKIKTTGSIYGFRKCI